VAGGEHDIADAIHVGDERRNGSEPTQEDGRPAPIGKAARCGLAGRVLDLIEPRSEADPAAVLMTFLAAFGSLCDRRAHIVRDRKHCANLFVCIVGKTGVGRKGTSWTAVEQLIDKAEPRLAEEAWTGVGRGRHLSRSRLANRAAAAEEQGGAGAGQRAWPD
jgi:hypothetical protein